MPSQPGQGKTFVFYTTVLLVAGSSVMFGLDWTAAPLPPMAETAASVQAAKLAAHLPPPVVRVAKAEDTLSPVRPLDASTQRPALAAVNPSPQGTQDTYGTPSIVAPEQAAQPVSVQPKCDVAACSAAYHSFRVTDCSWQPYEGPRRFCDKGQPPPAAATTVAAGNGAAAGVAQVSNKCDIAACKQAYFTFNPADCTYQPSDGPRRLCDKGHPTQQPQAQTVIDPAVAAANAANAANAAKGAPAPPKCNVEACKQAYFTFNPLDCTYQPSQGPRTLCAK